MIYNFTKENDCRKLIKEINEWGPDDVQKVVVVENEIEVETKEELSPERADALTHLVMTHNQFIPDPQLVSKDKVVRARTFGNDMIADFAAENIAMGLSDAQTGQAALQFASIQSLLQSGSLRLARMAIAGIVPNPIVSAERRQKYLDRIDRFLDTL